MHLNFVGPSSKWGVPFIKMVEWINEIHLNEVPKRLFFQHFLQPSLLKQTHHKET